MDDTQVNEIMLVAIYLCSQVIYAIHDHGAHNEALLAPAYSILIYTSVGMHVSCDISPT